MITTIDGVSFELKEKFDFEFLSEYGEVFTVFDKQDSGYLCFGVQNDDKKLFLKMAGAATIKSSVSTEVAISRLKSTVSIYNELRHPTLIEMIDHKNIKNSYLTVFDWFEGECMGKQYDSFEKFFALPLDKKLSIYNDILLFHIHANECGYIALDFYDGSIMYDFVSGNTKICDVEFYTKKPVINTLGRMWGSSRYMSPEEFQLGAEIDEKSNVYLMGATAFQLFGGGKERNFDEWQANEDLFWIALKAISRAKNDRYQSIHEYYLEWNKAILN